MLWRFVGAPGDLTTGPHLPASRRLARRGWRSPTGVPAQATTAVPVGDTDTSRTTSSRTRVRSRLGSHPCPAIVREQRCGAPADRRPRRCPGHRYRHRNCRTWSDRRLAWSCARDLLEAGTAPGPSSAFLNPRRSGTRPTTRPRLLNCPRRPERPRTRGAWEYATAAPAAPTDVREPAWSQIWSWPCTLRVNASAVTPASFEATFGRQPGPEGPYGSPPTSGDASAHIYPINAHSWVHAQKRDRGKATTHGQAGVTTGPSGFGQHNSRRPRRRGRRSVCGRGKVACDAFSR